MPPVTDSSGKMTNGEKYGSRLGKDCKLSQPPLLPYPPGCRTGRLLRREKRFSMAVELDGRQIWAHTNNTGSMLGLLRPGSPVLLSPAANPARKLAWTVEALGLGRHGVPDPDSPDLFWVGVNTSVPNRFLSAAFAADLLPWAHGYSFLKREAVHGESRLDGLCTGAGRVPLWIECKNVTLVEDGAAAFPDAVTERGAKHLGTLRRLVAEGCRAAMLYLVQRPDGQCFGPADYIDPAYAAALHEALAHGVEAYAVVARVTPDGIFHDHDLIVKPQEAAVSA